MHEILFKRNADDCQYNIVTWFFAFYLESKSILAGDSESWVVR